MNAPLRIGRATLLVFVGWSAAIAFSLWGAAATSTHQTEELSRIEAEALFQKDVVYRSWAAMHGGVYVPATETTPPSPYLADIAERDITTPSGRRLTLVNPAYMTRQVHELDKKRFGTRGHITSLNPINPGNAPDDWERAALQSFEKGALERSSVETMEGAPYMRFMRPLMTEKSCLNCHTVQGYREGDVRGGISVAVPLAPFLASANRNMGNIRLVHAAFWLLGGAGILAGGTAMRRRARAHAQAEDALRRSELEWEVTFNAMSDWVSLLDVDTRKVIKTNHAGEKLLGIPADRIVGRRCCELVHGTTSPMQGCPLVETRSTGKATRMEFQPEDKDCWLTVSVDPVLDEQGNIVSAVHVVRDTTVRHLAELEILRLNAELEQRVNERTADLRKANEEMQAFTYSVSHDLRAPLRSIDGFTRIVLEDYGDVLPAEAQSNLRTVIGNIGRLDDLVSDMLTLSRMGRSRMSRRRIVTNALVGEVVEEIRPQWQDRRMELEVRDLPNCYADPGLLKQIFVNLISNAVKFTRVRDVAHIEIGAEIDGEETAYFVRDNGIGFDMSYVGKVFGVFNRLHSSHEYEGTGIGLAIVERVVLRHGGRVWAESAPDQGACFRFTLGTAGASHAADT